MKGHITMYYTVKIYNSYDELVKEKKFWAYNDSDAERRAASIVGTLPENWFWTLTV